MKQLIFVSVFSLHFCLSLVLAGDLEQDRQVSISQLLLQAEIALNLDQWERSLSLFRQITEINAESVSAWIGVGISLNHLKLHGEAVEAIQVASRLSPSDASIQAILARTYLKNRQYAKADKWYQKAIKLHPETAPVKWYLDLGFIETQYGNLEQARRYYIVAIQLYPQSIAAYRNLGLLLLNQNRLDEADACFYTALTVRKDIGSALFGRGEVAFKRANYKQAVGFYRQAIKLEPTIPQYYRAMGQAMLRLGQIQEGQDYSAKAKRLRAEQFRQEAYQEAQQQNWSQVISKLRLATERDPSYVSALEDLAYVYVQQEQLLLAESVLSKGLKLVTDWAPGYWQRGEVRFQRKLYDLAEVDLRKAIELAPAAVPPKFALARLLFAQHKSLSEALELAETANRLSPEPRYHRLWLDVKKKLD